MHGFGMGGLGVALKSVVKLHQATRNFKGIEKDDDWLRLELFILYQKHMVPVWSLTYFTYYA